ncbi:MAG: peptide ABC transporter substrate-binding protein [Deltaproteobacteria bacterium]|nr:peptide ABC transporter substrate-binding protein [Deltaproteobacteria bacterium]
MRTVKVLVLGLLVMSLALLPAVAMAKKMTIVYGNSDKTVSYDPIGCNDIHGMEVIFNVFPCLFKFVPGSTEVEPDLAESYTVSEGGKVYIFKLRQGLKFPDGTPFNAEVVKYSIERAFKIEANYSWMVTRFVEKVEVLSEYEVKFVLKSPATFFPAVIAVAAYAPVNPNVYPMDATLDWPEEMAGLGPYKAVSFKRDEEVILEANPDYWGEKPKNDRIVIRYFADPTTMRLAFEKGEVDICYRTLGTPDILDLRQSGKYIQYESPSPLIHFLDFYCAAPPFDNKTVRQGVGAAIDREQIAQLVFQGTVKPVYSMMAFNWWSYIPAFETAYGKANVVLAKELLAKAGYNEGNKLKFELWYTPHILGPNEVDLATNLKSQWEATGVMEVKVEAVEWAAFMQGMGEGAYQANLLGWIPDYIDVDGFLGALSDVDMMKSVNGTHFDSSEWAAMAAQAAAEVDQEKRKAIYQKIQQAWAKEAPQVPLVQSAFFPFTHKDIEGIEFTPAGMLLYNNIVKK